MQNRLSAMRGKLVPTSSEVIAAGLEAKLPGRRRHAGAGRADPREAPPV